ncbi:protein ANTAGONIST OF LIKE HETEROCHROMATIN PROTEIN 1 isoform X2 [Tachysurus fulvidraco]|nr:protein ANTAGONIST OF LIKE HETEROCHROMATIN PROTEIN 1 isoform X2 [Tachysurus fulvidraco]
MYYLLRRRPPSVWVHQRANDWWTVVVPNFTDDQWSQNFRMSEETFLYLCHRLRTAMEKRDTNFRLCVPIKKRVAIALWKLTTNSELRLVSHLFGVGVTTVWRCVREFCSAVNEVLLPELIPFPNNDKLMEMAMNFEQRYGLPQCVGVIAGSHIPNVPTEYHAEYFNHMGWHSIILQGVVDGNGLFWHVFAGSPGSMHEATVLHVSGLWDLIGQGLFPNNSKNIAGHDVGYYLLGNAALPLQSWLMKPFSVMGQLTAEQVAYNQKIYQAICVAENSFVRLKGRWRCLQKRNDSHIDLIKTMVLTCCVLHNFCETHGEQYSEEWDPPAAGDQILMPLSPEGDAEGAAVGVRDALVHYLNTDNCSTPLPE